MSKPKKWWFEVSIPVHEIWVFRVQAADEDEAIEMAEEAHPDAEQVYSVSGSEGARTTAREFFPAQPKRVRA